MAVNDFGRQTNADVVSGSPVAGSQSAAREDRAEAPSAASWLDGAMRVVGTAFGFYYLTSLIVVVTVAFSLDFVRLCAQHGDSANRVDMVSAFAAWDGRWYVRIASSGYGYDPEQESSVAFFPLYPWLAAAIIHTTGLRPEWALLIVSHGALVGAFALLMVYARRRFPAADAGLAEYSVLAMALFPTTFYFRMAYTESLFVMLTLLALYGMERRWPGFWVALVIGLATATRSVGVALLPVFAWYEWQQPAGTRARLIRLGILLPVCCWGLVAYVLFQWSAFGEPLAFVKTQTHWNQRSMGLMQQAVGLVTFEPIRAVYDRTSVCDWARVPPQGNLLFNLKAATPVFFLGTVGFVLLGAVRRWLNGRELLLSAGLLLIPYCVQAGRACMSAQARYAAVVFPVYIVLGQLLHRAPAALAAALLALAGVFLAIYSALFAGWYWFY